MGVEAICIQKDEKTFILLDKLIVNLSTNVKKAFYNCNVAVEYISSGYTLLLQVCNVSETCLSKIT
jgi:hypothetical protein